jgi:Peptidyl-tRNA hydrolase PTH2
MDSRLYIIGRADLAPGLRAAQGGHAAFAFALEHPRVMKRWNNSYLIFLEVDDHHALRTLLRQTQLAGLTTSEWHEPDLDDQLTAIAIAPSESSKLLCAGLPLMLHEPSPLEGSSLPRAPRPDSSTARAAVSKTDDEGPIPSLGTHLCDKSLRG